MKHGERPEAFITCTTVLQSSPSLSVPGDVQLTLAILARNSPKTLSSDLQSETPFPAANLANMYSVDIRFLYAVELEMSSDICPVVAHVIESIPSTFKALPFLAHLF